MKNSRKHHRTRDGKKILFSKLTEDHLQNIIRNIERKAKEGLEVIAGSYGCTAEEMSCDTYTIYGEDVKAYMGYLDYVAELKKRPRRKVI